MPHGNLLQKATLLCSIDLEVVCGARLRADGKRHMMDGTNVADLRL